MPDFVKRFWYVKENTFYFPTIIKGFINPMGDWSELANAGVIWFKPRLLLRYQVVFIEKIKNVSNLSKIFLHIGRSETGL